MKMELLSRLWSLRIFQPGDEFRTLQAQQPAAGMYNIIARARPGSGEETTTQMVGDPANGLHVARRCDRPVELWLDNDHLCTIDTVAGAGTMWVISPSPTHARKRVGGGGPASSRPVALSSFETVFCKIDGLHETDIGDSVALAAKTMDEAEHQVARLRPPPGVNCVKVLENGKVALRWLYPATSGSDDPPDAETVKYYSASEQMFYAGMPLAHVVAYEQFLRNRRLRRLMDMRRYPALSEQLR